MQKLILLAVVLTASISASARARIPVCMPCEYLETTLDLPAETEFIGESNDPLNVGYRFEQINIIWIPIWNYEGEYCLVNDAEDMYYDLTEDEKAYLTETHQASFEGSPLSLWDKMGGKAIILIILALILWGAIPSKKNKEEENTQTAEQG